MGARSEKAYVRYAWIIFVVLPGFHFVFGLAMIFAPAAYFESLLESAVPGSEATALLTPGSLSHAGAHVGSVFVGWALMLEAVALYGYRRGERWSWYALAYLPVLFAYDASLHLPRLEDMALQLLFLGVALLGLILPFRRFFPRNV